MKIVVGNGLLEKIGNYCRKLGFNEKVLVLTGPHVYYVAGKTVLDYLEDSRINADYFIVKEPTFDVVEEVQEVIREVRPETLVAVGGGKVIDVAKLASFRENLPFISVPTAASHDGIASPSVSLKRRDRTPVSLMAQPPMAIIADVDVIMRAPSRLLASGCGDIVAKLTAVRDARLAYMIKGEYCGDYALSLALLSAKHVMRSVDLIARRSEAGVRTLIEALISCGVAMSIAGSSRPCSGSEHLFSHALDLIAPKPALHGEQVGVGTIMMAYLHRMNWRRVKEFLRRVGAPTTAKELGIDEYYVVEALTIAHKVKPRRYTILGETGLTWEAAERLAKATGVIE
ncbi:MAG: NAD(P)-dependent glycerol-1-phosphate dehydrogenase [Thermoprotei archaeon]|nr:MAG: NAD(P)-dependent glycerol-1-phosphate dehydrogenase [Thermoprotei archaeon]